MTSQTFHLHTPAANPHGGQAPPAYLRQASCPPPSFPPGPYPPRPMRPPQPVRPPQVANQSDLLRSLAYLAQTQRGVLTTLEEFKKETAKLGQALSSAQSQDRVSLRDYRDKIQSRLSCIEERLSMGPVLGRIEELFAAQTALIEHQSQALTGFNERQLAVLDALARRQPTHDRLSCAEASLQQAILDREPSPPLETGDAVQTRSWTGRQRQDFVQLYNKHNELEELKAAVRARMSRRERRPAKRGDSKRKRPKKCL